MNRIAQYLDQPAVLPIVPSNEHRCYDAQGHLVPPTTSIDVLTFDGGSFGSEAPLQFNMTRHFDPTVGVWMSEDPIGHANDDEHLRTYVGE
jgi:RHS repeat-associated protein